MDLNVARPEGLHCPPGDFYIDPWRPVERAVITHGHSDHARAGHASYLAQKKKHRHSAQPPGRHQAADTPLWRTDAAQWRLRLAASSRSCAGLRTGAGRIQGRSLGRVWRLQTEHDGTCEPLEPVACHTSITESTFGVAVYRWPAQADLSADINQWWRGNAAAGRASVLFCYAFGKAQRILHGVDASIGPIVVHGAVEPLNQVYRDAGVRLPATQTVAQLEAAAISQALVLAPPSAQGTPWMRRFGGYSDAFASGWMLLRGTRRRRGVDRGFVMSDHADWPGLQRAIAGTGAQRVFVTHGSVAVMVRWLRERGLDAQAFKTEYGAEDVADQAAAPDTA